MKEITLKKLENYVAKVREGIYEEDGCQDKAVPFSALLFHLENIVGIITHNERNK